MTDVCFYFQVHQPYRLAHLRARGWEGSGLVKSWEELFDDKENERIAARVAERGYIATNEVLARCIEETDGAFRCSFSISGTALRQLEAWAPEALASFQALGATGCVEFLCETSHHSLSALTSMEEFREQVREQKERIERLFGVTPTTFRNTELIISEDIAREVEALGFEALLGEGADALLDWRSPHVVYRPPGCSELGLLLRDYPLSDDIAFRFSNKEWPGYPLMADTFAKWLSEEPEPNDFIGLFMDYETFGEHQDRSTGILDFMQVLPGFATDYDNVRFRTPAEVVRDHPAVGELAIPRPVSWADEERDLSGWLGNPMQRVAHEALYDLRTEVLESAAAGAPELLEAWRRLSTSDHVYYMATKADTDGDVHEYFSPYPHPHEAFTNFMNVLNELRELLHGARNGAAAVTLDAPKPASASKRGSKKS